MRKNTQKQLTLDKRAKIYARSNGCSLKYAYKLLKRAAHRAKQEVFKFKHKKSINQGGQMTNSFNLVPKQVDSSKTKKIMEQLYEDDSIIIDHRDDGICVRNIWNTGLITKHHDGSVRNVPMGVCSLLVKKEEEVVINGTSFLVQDNEI